MPEKDDAESERARGLAHGMVCYLQIPRTI